MTVEDAIKSIDDVLNSDYHYDESIGYQMTSDDFEWLEKSKEALEKQIPKKLCTDNEGWYCCPNCGETFKLFDEFMKPNKYCGRCGQTIDWSEYIIEKGSWKPIKDKYYDELVTVKLFKDNIFADDVFVTVDDDTIIVPRGVAVKIPRKHAIKLVDIESKKLEKIYPSKGDDAE